MDDDMDRPREVDASVDLNAMKQVTKVAAALKRQEGLCVREKFTALKAMLTAQYRLEGEQINEVIRIDHMRKSSVWLEDLKVLGSSDSQLLITLSNTGEAHIVTYSRSLRVTPFDTAS